MESNLTEKESLKRVTFVKEEDIDYKKILNGKRATLFFKRAFDILASFFGILLVSPILIITSILVLVTSRGGILFKQVRVGKNQKLFKIFKFRTMIADADKKGSLVTVAGDVRITKLGRFLRKTKIDELPQLFNILIGQMSFVGPRPLVAETINEYSDYEKNTLLVRPGVTGRGSILFKDENELLETSDNPEYMYKNVIMPKKIKLELDYLKNLSFFTDIKLIFKTLGELFK